MKALILTALLAAAVPAAMACDDPLPAGNLAAVSPEVVAAAGSLLAPEAAIPLSSRLTKDERYHLPPDQVEARLRAYNEDLAAYASSHVHLRKTTNKCPNKMPVLACGHSAPSGTVSIVSPGVGEVTMTWMEWHLLHEGQAVAGLEAELRRLLKMEARP